MLVEFYYQLKSKIFWVLLCFVILVSIFMFVSQVGLMNGNFKSFEMNISMSKEQGQNIDELLKGSFNKSSDGNIEMIDNPVKYYYLATCSSIIALAPHNAINQLFVSSFFIIFPVICGVYGIVVAYTDRKYRTSTLQNILFSPRSVNCRKIFASVISITISLFSAIVTFLFGQILYNFFGKFPKSPMIDFKSLAKISYLRMAPLQILILMSSSTLFFIITYYLTIVCKNVFAPSFVLAVYNLVLPSLGKYDLKNIMYNAYTNFFNTNAATYTMDIGKSYEISNFAYFIPLIFIILFVALSETIYENKIVQTEK